MAKSKETFSRYDTADYLETETDIAAYLTACAEEDDPALLVAALGDVARARNMTQLAEKTGMTRMGLYKALSGQGNPSFATVSKVAHALGLKITVAAVLEGIARGEQAGAKGRVATHAQAKTRLSRWLK